MRSRSLIIAGALAGAVATVGCSPRMFGMMAPMVFTAAIVGTAVAMSYHDAHFHSPECGHQARYYEDHWVYYYGDHWEYYDPNTGRWYLYRGE